MFSLSAARAYFEEYHLPRRAHDRAAEEDYFKKTGQRKDIYRRVLRDEKERGELYPLCGGFTVFSDFGVGVGLYFTQLVVLIATYIVGGIIMISAATVYKSHDYHPDSYTGYLSVSAACSTAINVTATINCPGGALTCEVKYREHCDLPAIAAFADLGLSLFFVLAISASKYLEDDIEELLDESVQTAQDYALEVTDPPAQCVDPDNWLDFFTKYGEVRYITVAKRNKEVLDLLVEKMSLMKALGYAKQSEYESVVAVKDGLCSCADSKSKSHARLHAIDQLLAACYLKVYEASTVFVLFEREASKRHAYESLEVADINSIFDRTDQIKERNRFQEEVLSVQEPAEPDCVLWSNLQFTDKSRSTRSYLAKLFSLGILVCCYYIIEQVRKASNPTLFGVTIGIIDGCLPSLFLLVTGFEKNRDEGTRQGSLQFKLFAARLLMSTIFPYINTPWNTFLDDQVLESILYIQIAACFTTATLNFLDIVGIVMRNVVAPLAASNQQELNNSYAPTSWCLAERYTGVGKIFFLTLFYALLNPLAIVIAIGSFVFIFLVDRFLLLRRWEQAPLMNRSVAHQLRSQMILGVAAHMFATSRFIYSWPMDSANVVSPSPGRFEYAYVDKYPSYVLWSLRTADWMSPGQRQVLYIYIIITLFICSVAVYILILDPVRNFIYHFFWKDASVVGDPSNVNLSSVARICCYFPHIRVKNLDYEIALAKQVQPHHKPSLSQSDDTMFLVKLVPEKYREHVFSIVKRYPSASDAENPKYKVEFGSSSGKPAGILPKDYSFMMDKIPSHVDAVIDAGPSSLLKAIPSSRQLIVKGDGRKRVVRTVARRTSVTEDDIGFELGAMSQKVVGEVEERKEQSDSDSEPRSP